MDKSYYSNMQVSEETIDELRSLGMAASIQKAMTGNASPEFIEAVRRFYPGVVDQIDQSRMERVQENIPEDTGGPIPGMGGGEPSPMPTPEAMARRNLMGGNLPEGGGAAPFANASSPAAEPRPQPNSPGLVDTESRPGKVGLNLGELNPVKSGVVDTSRPGKVGLNLGRLAEVLGLGFDPPNVSNPDMSQVVDTSNPGKVGLNLGALLKGGGGGKAPAPSPQGDMLSAIQRKLKETGGAGGLR